MLSFKRVGVLAVSWKTLHTPFKFDGHTSRAEWTDSDTNLGLSCLEKVSQFAAVVRKLSVPRKLLAQIL